MPQDHVDRILAQWGLQRPHVNVSPMGIFGRINRFARLTSKQMEPLYQAHGISPERFDVLATLLRSGPPHRLSPTQLYQALMITSGTMTNRLDQLEKSGHIERIPDPDDRRGTLIQLTPLGLETVDKALVDHVAAEERFLAPLTQEERESLAALLRKLLLPLE